jgi:hypothetical protein
MPRRVSWADANALGDRSLILDADVSRLVRRPNIGLCLLGAARGDGLSIHGKCHVATPADPAAVIGRVNIAGDLMATLLARSCNAQAQSLSFSR